MNKSEKVQANFVACVIAIASAGIAATGFMSYGLYLLISPYTGWGWIGMGLAMIFVFAALLSVTISE
jgi:hypothetical protein